MVHLPTTTLSAAECVALLAPSGVGRVAISLDALPAVIPVRYRWTPDALVLASPTHLRHASGLTNAVVTLEVDSLADDGEGWAVNVTGRASLASPGEHRLPVEAITGWRYKTL